MALGIRRAGLLLGLLVVIAIAAVAWWLWASLPRQDGVAQLRGLTDAVHIDADDLGIPTVRAANRGDAFRALGYLHARDRLFQMDLARRKSSGRLAELFGPAVVALDVRQRHYQVERSAQEILAVLPPDQREVLSAYAEGVNGYLAGSRDRPIEMIALGYQPEPWRPEDSLLVAFGMFQTLTSQEQDERMLSVMHTVLAPEIVDFLTPDTDDYATVLIGGKASRRPRRPTPVGAIGNLLRASRGSPPLAGVDPDVGILGSNQWAVSGRKTRDGRAMVVNDMHLGLGVPNIWYRAQWLYGDARFSGLTLPGLPLPIAGSNDRIAWGFTNVDADVADLITLQLHPDDADRYRTAEGWRALQRWTEKVKVRDAMPVDVALTRTLWGPLLPDPLLGQPVVLRWTALDPHGVNLGLIDMDRVTDLEEAVRAMNRAGIPPQNVVLADDQGRIAWTYAGKLPNRHGYDGAVATSWADGRRGWRGYVPPAELPRLFDPQSGIIATANNRTVGAEYPYVVGHNFAHSYRAYRIAQRLAESEGIAEPDMLALQLDTVSEFFEYYRALVLRLGRLANGAPDILEAQQAVAAWNGRLDVDSVGIALLVEYRTQLMKSVFGALLAACSQADTRFSFGWREAETPLRALLSERSPETLPDRRRRDWDDYLLAELSTVVRRMKADAGGIPLRDLPWGRLNRVTIRHPLARAVPMLSAVLDMPELESPGCSGHCVRVVSGDKGASERFVVSPGHIADGLMHMPGGQSGHPLSRHYRDQQHAWAEGLPLPFAAGTARARLILRP